MYYKIKVFLMTICLCVLILSVASITIFKPRTFNQNMSSYYKRWQCKNLDDCTFRIYPNKSNYENGIKYQIPKVILERIIKDYMNQSNTMYS